MGGDQEEQEIHQKSPNTRKMVVSDLLFLRFYIISPENENENEKLGKERKNKNKKKNLKGRRRIHWVCKAQRLKLGIVCLCFVLFYS